MVDVKSQNRQTLLLRYKETILLDNWGPTLVVPHGFRPPLYPYLGEAKRSKAKLSKSGHINAAAVAVNSLLALQDMGLVPCRID